jgi:hypothetical protein
MPKWIISTGTNENYIAFNVLVFFAPILIVDKYTFDELSVQTDEHFFFPILVT